MFTRRLFAPVAPRFVQASRPSVRQLSAAPASREFKPKTLAQAWMADVGAYPVMGVIVFAVAFCTGTMIYFVSTMPDARVSKSSRRELFRGELRGER